MAPSFPQRKIGDDSVSAIGLGCMGMSVPSSSGAPDEDACLRVLTAAADMGLDFWVTSDSYGTNERILGRWFRETGRRDEIFLASKFGVKRVDVGQIEICGHPDYVRAACRASLENLQTDHIDLYLQHRVDGETPIEKTVEAMAQLKKEGKIRYLGLSECSARTLRRAHKVHPIAAAEMEYSPFALDIESTETDFLKTARELGVSIVAYSPLGRGFLLGTVKSLDDLDEMDRRRLQPRYYPENFGQNLKLVDAMVAMAKEKDCTPGQLTLAWILAQGDDFVPIPGTKHIKYLEENAGAAHVKLSKEDDEKIRKIIASLGGRKGARYPEALLAQCFGDSPELGSD